MQQTKHLHYHITQNNKVQPQQKIYYSHCDFETGQELPTETGYNFFFFFLCPIIFPTSCYIFYVHMLNKKRKKKHQVTCQKTTNQVISNITYLNSCIEILKGKDIVPS